MLKLNSSYARFYLRDANHFQDESKRIDKTDHKMKQQSNVEISNPQAYILRRQPNSNNEQKAIERYDEERKQPRYAGQIYSSSTVGRKHHTYDYQNQNQDIGFHNSKSVKFGQQQKTQYQNDYPQMRQPKFYYKNDILSIKKDLKPNHSRRNDAIRDNLLREEKSKGYEMRRNHYNNNKYEYEEEELCRNYQSKNMGHYQYQLQNRQSYNRFQQAKSNQAYQESEIDKFYSSPSLNRRKADIQARMIQNTPQKRKTTMYEPGSEEKKRSLIEKSQILQQKLRQLNIQKPALSIQTLKYSQQKHSMPSFVNEFRQPQYRPQKQNNHGQRKSQIFTSSNSPLSSPLNKYKLNARNANHQASPAPPNNYENKYINYAAHNTKANKAGDAIQKITQLNEKINERIQSIISNYTKN